MFPRPFSGQYSADSVDCYREKEFFLLRQPQAARGTSAWLSVDANLLANSGSSTQLDARIPRQTQGPSRRVSNVDVPQPNPSPPYHPALFMSVFRRQPPYSNPSPTPAQGPSTHTTTKAKTTYCSSIPHLLFSRLPDPYTLKISLQYAKFKKQKYRVRNRFISFQSRWR